MRNKPGIRPAGTTGHGVANDPEVIDRAMRELRAARAFANRPDAGSRGLQAFVDLNKAAWVQCDSYLIEPNIRRIRDPADRHQQMTAFDLPFCGRRPARYRYRVSIQTIDPGGVGAQGDI